MAWSHSGSGMRGWDDFFVVCSNNVLDSVLVAEGTHRRINASVNWVISRSCNDRVHLTAQTYTPLRYTPWIWRLFLLCCQRELTSTADESIEYVNWANCRWLMTSIYSNTDWLFKLVDHRRSFSLIITAYNTSLYDRSSYTWKDGLYIEAGPSFWPPSACSPFSRSCEVQCTDDHPGLAARSCATLLAWHSASVGCCPRGVVA